MILFDLKVNKKGVVLNKINRYDLHMHTNFSSDSINRPEKIVEIAKKAGLNGVAITDHHTIRGALTAKKLNRDKNFEVIIGEEIKTNYGDVIALYIKEEINEIDFWEVIDHIKKQGGLIIIPHPFRLWPKFGYPLEKLRGKIDGIEVFNSRDPLSNAVAAEKTKRLTMAEIGSSDGHLPLDIGKGYTVFEGDLRSAIKKRRTISGGTIKFGLISRVVSAIRMTIAVLLRREKNRKT